MKFSEELKLFKKNNGLTQDKMASVLGISLRMCQYYERGDYDGSDSNIDYYRERLKKHTGKDASVAHLDNKFKEPETYGEFIELYRKLVKQLEERVEVQDKYIALLEANAAKVKAS